MIESIGIALTGLDAASKRLSASASNIANLQTVGSLEDGRQAPYTPIDTQQTARENGGVNTTFVQRDPAFVPAFDPDSPFADENGVIGVPNINLAEEAVNITLAEITYKANLKTLQAASDLTKELFNAVDEEA